MSTYYALFCNECRDKVHFVSSSGEDYSFTWMGPAAMAEVTVFMGRHVHHLNRLEVISEVDPRWYGVGADERDDYRIRREPASIEAEATMSERQRWQLSEGLRIVGMLMLLAVAVVAIPFVMALLTVWE